MDENHTNFTFDENYSVGQFPHISNDLHSFNFPPSYVDDSSLIEINQEETFIEKFPVNSECLENSIEINTNNNGNEIKCEPIKSELNDINANHSLLSHSRYSRSNSNVTTVSNSNDVDVININNPPPEKQYPTYLKCEKCRFLTLSQHILDAHNIEHHHRNTFKDNNTTNEQKILCCGCENIFYSKCSLEAHLEYDHLMNKNEIVQLTEIILSPLNSSQENTKRSRIYLKNVDFLCNPSPVQTLNCTISSNNKNSDVDLINLINDNDENINNFQQNKISVKSAEVLGDILSNSQIRDENTHNHHQQHTLDLQTRNFYEINSNFETNIQTESRYSDPPAPLESGGSDGGGGEKRRRPKIYIKNVDILKEPIFVPTNNFTNILNMNADLSTLRLFPPTTGNNEPESSFDRLRSTNNLPPPSNDMQFNESEVETPKTKIFIKNVDVLKRENFQDNNNIPKKSSNSLHLRTVDELNLMNKNEVQNLFTPILDQSCNYVGINNASSENSKNSDEIAIVNYGNPDPEVEYNDGENFIDGNEHEIQMNWSNDYGFDGLENIIDSNSSLASGGDQKNPHFELNTPQRSINDDHDKDMLFVCAQEIINSNNNDDRNQEKNNEIELITTTGEKQQDLSFYTNSNFPPMEEQEVVEILDDLEKHQNDVILISEELQSDQQNDDVILVPEKGRIYVADNLMEDCKSSEDAKKPARGRPLGSKRTWVTMMKQRNKKSSSNVGYKCDQNCGMRFLKLETLEIHKQCHVSSSHPQRMQCPICKISNFTSWDTLHTHLWRNHQIDMDLYSCQHCDFKSPVLSRLINTHMKIHSDERNFKCEQCLKTFKNSKQLKNHRRIHREQFLKADKPNEIYRCEACGTAFSHVKSLRAHICKEKEQDRELFSCTICGKVVSNKSSLKQHLLTHEDPSKYKCEHCNYVTNDHNSFRRHNITHDKSKMYNCKFCNYKCIQSNLYQKHVLKEHPNEADQVIFKCPTCSFSTINQAKYNLHVAKHGDSAIQVDLQNKNNHAQQESGLSQMENNFSSKIKVKSNLVLTDPTRLVNNNLLQNFDIDIT